MQARPGNRRLQQSEERGTAGPRLAGGKGPENTLVCSSFSHLGLGEEVADLLQEILADVSRS